MPASFLDTGQSDLVSVLMDARNFAGRISTSGAAPFAGQTTFTGTSLTQSVSLFEAKEGTDTLLLTQTFDVTSAGTAREFICYELAGSVGYLRGTFPEVAVIVGDEIAIEARITFKDDYSEDV